MTIVSQSDVITTGIQVVQTSNPTEVVTVSPLGANQLIGNDGAGNIAPVTLTAGNNVTISQVNDNLQVSSIGANYGANSWVSIPSGTSAITSFDNGYTVISGLVQTVASIDSVIIANIGLSIQTDAQATVVQEFPNPPGTIIYDIFIVVYIYLSADASTPPNINGTPNAQVRRKINPAKFGNLVYGNSFLEACVPIFPVSTSFQVTVRVDLFSQGTITSTYLKQNPNGYSSFYLTESNQFSVVEPLSTSAVKCASSTFPLQPIASLATTPQTLCAGFVPATGSGSLSVIKITAPFYLPISQGVSDGYSELTILVYVGNTIYQIIQLDSFGSLTSDYGIFSVGFYTQPASFPPGSIFRLSATNYRGNAGFLSVLQAILDNASYGSCCIDNYLPNFNLASGSVVLCDERTYTRLLPANVSVYNILQNLNYFGTGVPGTPITLIPSMAIDTFNIEADYAQCRVDVAFEFNYTTFIQIPSGSSVPSPCFSCIVAYTTGSGSGLTVLSEVCTATESLMAPTNDSKTSGMLVKGSFYALSPSIQLTAYAFISYSSSSGTAPSYTSQGATANSPVVGSNSNGCFWVVTTQSLSNALGAAGASPVSAVETEAGSYITTTSDEYVTTIDSTPATSLQAGLVTADVVIPDTSLVQMSTTGAIGCSIVSADSSIAITTTEGSIDLSAFSAPANTISTQTGNLTYGTSNVISYQGVCDVTLPLTCPVGQVIKISSDQGSTFTILQNANQRIRAPGNVLSAIGVAGSATMNVDGGSTTLICVQQDVLFNVEYTSDSLTIVT